ncbi:hypothetical protein SKAU_G00397890 [Synaphobranchus kaupii]|uniref:Uncharacterized protein n=1 Tax=Synaphobranchus kaupii TaxID=118154 RepID=A0A9Q1E8H3_SYNKA|nr:hypothetical protein SKAU_G00397890 [Synaphobranchus kaupii]
MAGSETAPTYSTEQPLPVKDLPIWIQAVIHDGLSFEPRVDPGFYCSSSYYKDRPLLLQWVLPSMVVLTCVPDRLDRKLS